MSTRNDTGGLLNASTARGSIPEQVIRAKSRGPALTIVSHPLCERVGAVARFDGAPILLSRNAPDFLPPGHAIGKPLLDPFISRTPISLTPEDKGIRLSLDGSSTEVVAGVPVTDNILFSHEDVARGVVIELAGRVALLLHETLRPTSHVPHFDMVGHSPGLRAVREAILRIVDLDVPILIRGETGTGKELVARAIHENSTHKSGTFVSVNLGAIPKELAAAELFGSQKGAFTGAQRDREGFFRAAHGGTLFLDEVGEAPPEVQVLLLRVLETNEMYPVGADVPVKIDVRLIAATDARLEAQIENGTFKAPLLHRLAGYEIRLPPLRERPEDIGLLFYHFARQELEAIGESSRLDDLDPRQAPWLPPEVAANLVRHPWPGNIRQLRNITRQLVIQNRGQSQLQLDDRLANELKSVPPPAEDPPASVETPAAVPTKSEAAPAARRASDLTEAELKAALRTAKWDIKAAAELLGVRRSSLYDAIDRMPNIRTAVDLSVEEIEAAFEACGGDLDAMIERLEVSKRALKRRLKEIKRI